MATTLKGLIVRHNVRCEANWVGSHEEKYTRTYGGLSHYDMDDWKTTLRMHGRRMTVDFHTGQGLRGNDPSAYDVLYSLLSDASGIDNARDFEEWAREYGFDTDSRKAEKSYQDAERNTTKLRQFLGEHYNAFMQAGQE